MKRLVIAIDPGYDGCKICINEELYRFPFNMINITANVNDYPLANKDTNYVKYICNDQVYLVGEYARRAYFEDIQDSNKKASIENQYTIERFSTPEFEAALEAFIGLALYKYQEHTKELKDKNVDVFNISNMDQWEIHVSVALPHDFMDELWKKSIKNLLTKNHKFTLLVGGDTLEFNFDFDTEKSSYNSQAICALISVIADKNGEMEEGKTIFDYLPSLIINGGYKTLETFKLSRDGKIVQAESNTDFAMKNINDEVATTIQKKVNNVYGYMIDEKYFSNGTFYYEENGEVLSFDVKKLRDEATLEKSKQLIDYLMTKHNKLLDIKTIIVAGGTGGAYYDTIKEFTDKRANLKDSVWLANNGFDGNKCDTVFSIVIGLYKAMISDIS